MKTKSFIPSPQRHTSDKKPTDYWGMLFVGLIFLSSIGCFLFANHSERTSTSVSINTVQLSAKVIDVDQNSKS